MSLTVQALDQPGVPPLAMPERFRHEVTYFMSLPGERDVPASLGRGEYWVRQDDARRWLDDGIVEIVSPLDSENKTEIELSEEQEAWLEWLLEHGVQHMRLV